MSVEYHDKNASKLFNRITASKIGSRVISCSRAVFKSMSNLNVFYDIETYVSILL